MSVSFINFFFCDICNIWSVVTFALLILMSWAGRICNWDNLHYSIKNYNNNFFTKVLIVRLIIIIMIIGILSHCFRQAVGAAWNGSMTQRPWTYRLNWEQVSSCSSWCTRRAPLVLPPANVCLCSCGGAHSGSFLSTHFLTSLTEKVYPFFC